jgi:hypothetical protein
LQARRSPGREVGNDDPSIAFGARAADSPRSVC